MEEVTTEEKFHSLRRIKVAVIGALALLLLLGGTYIAIQRFTGKRAIVSTPLPSLAPEKPLQVGPLAIAESSVLVIVTPELHAKIAAGGAARIIKIDPDRLPGQEPSEIPLRLSGPVWNELLAGLGRLKAAWTTRLVGESAGDEDASIMDGEPDALILVEELRADGGHRIIMRLRPDDPEYENLRDLLTPLRVSQ